MVFMWLLFEVRDIWKYFISRQKQQQRGPKFSSDFNFKFKLRGFSDNGEPQNRKHFFVVLRIGKNKTLIAS